MITVSQCRRILGKKYRCDDAGLEKILEEMYLLANTLLDVFLESPGRPGIGSFESILQMLPVSARDAFEERAAILEFDAGLSRHDAERSAIAAYFGSQADGEQR